ncbi:MAG: GNAT family N-acetyltransferase [Bacteroidia bacterium]|nr:GNAT family N-acetyltransferase [Bacteroidia bacterium]
MTAINLDPRVMEYFPSTQDKEQTAGFIQRMQKSFLEKSYCYYAVDELGGGLIGFVGFMDKDFKSDFTPAVDIGWRLATAHWNKGYALEGARACMDYGFKTLGFKNVISIAPKINERSEKIMKRLGMNKRGEFKHPDLSAHPRLETCVVYELRSDNGTRIHSR